MFTTSVLSPSPLGLRGDTSGRWLISEAHLLHRLLIALARFRQHGFNGGHQSRADTDGFRQPDALTAGYEIGNVVGGLPRLVGTRAESRQDALRTRVDSEIVLDEPDEEADVFCGTPVDNIL